MEVLVQRVPSEGSWSCRVANEEPLRVVYSRRRGKKISKKNKITWKWVALGGRSRISLQWQPPPSSRQVALSPHLAHLLVPNKRLWHEGSHCQKNVPICENKQTSHLFQGKCGLTMVSRRQVWLVRLQSCTTNVQHWQGSSLFQQGTRPLNHPGLIWTTLKSNMVHIAGYLTAEHKGFVYLFYYLVILYLSI